MLVLDPVNGKAAAAMVDQRQDARTSRSSPTTGSSTVPVDYYMSFDNETGRQAAGADARRRGEGRQDRGNILMLNGAPTDPNAGQFKKGAHSVLDESGSRSLAEYDNPDWSPDNAQQ